MSKTPKKKVPAKKTATKRAAVKMGRPSAYKEEYAELAYNYCLLGATDDDLAKFFGVSEVTINAWKKDQPDFLKSLKEGKSEADANVAQSLYRKAIGYSHKDTKFATFEGKITDAKEYIKHYAPDTVACIFWLKNRQPDLWRDKQELETTNTAELVISEEKQNELIEAMQHAVGVRAPEGHGK